MRVNACTSTSTDTQAMSGIFTENLAMNSKQLAMSMPVLKSNPAQHSLILSSLWHGMISHGPRGIPYAAGASVCNGNEPASAGNGNGAGA